MASVVLFVVVMAGNQNQFVVSQGHCTLSYPTVSLDSHHDLQPDFTT